MVNFQHTLRRPVKAAGIGLHSGEKISLKINPSPVNTGICFVRTDLNPQQFIPAQTKYVVDTRFATTIGNERCSISTIEHLMAAFAGVGINNALIEVDGPEVPAMDGSAAPFVNLLQKAGLKTQKEPIQYIEILEPVIVKKGDKLLSIEPCKDFIVSFEIEFEHPLIAKQRFVDKITPQTFAHKISKARTFGFLNEVELLRENGFALGGSLDNAVVMSDTSIYNSGGLRFSDEFVRHKVLDLIGDLYLLGAPILGRVKAVKSGHSLHHVFNQELLRHLYSWEYSEHESGWLIPSWFGQKEDMVSAIVSA